MFEDQDNNLNLSYRSQERAEEESTESEQDYVPDYKVNEKLKDMTALSAYEIEKNLKTENGRKRNQIVILMIALS